MNSERPDVIAGDIFNVLGGWASGGEARRQ